MMIISPYEKSFSVTEGFISTDKKFMIYVVSDIHARYDLFRRLLDRIKFSNSDTLISCGDIIDKGKDSTAFWAVSA